MLADLHVHTIASDGLYTPEEVCTMAINAGLGGIAITDHDTLDGVWELGKNSPANLEVLPGVEISTTWRGKDIHILGYNIDPLKGFLGEKLLEFQQERQRRLTRMVEKLRGLGYKIEEEDIIVYAEGQSVGRPHVAQALVEKGYFKNIGSAFDELLQTGAPAYIPREKVMPREGIEAIKSSGGVPVLAHPGLVSDGLELIVELVPLGLKGVEVYYPLHSEDFIIALLTITQQYSLLATGGSDFHGYRNDFLGKATVDLSVIQAIKEAS